MTRSVATESCRRNSGDTGDFWAAGDGICPEARAMRAFPAKALILDVGAFRRRVE